MMDDRREDFPGRLGEIPDNCERTHGAAGHTLLLTAHWDSLSRKEREALA